MSVVQSGSVSKNLLMTSLPWYGFPFHTREAASEYKFETSYKITKDYNKQICENMSSKCLLIHAKTILLGNPLW